jgi:DNA primase
MKMLHFTDPPCMPVSGAGPGEILACARPLARTAGQAYVERRGIAVETADAIGLRFAEDFGGRPAVVAPLRDQNDNLRSVHGRYLHTRRGQNKMLTIGTGNGVIVALAGWRAEPMIVVEGLFDALSLAACGWPCVATIGRWATWLPEVTAGRRVWLAFDAGRPGEAEVARYRQGLADAEVDRLLPPPRCKDWNTALRKRGDGVLVRWLQEHVDTGGDQSP